MSNNYLRAACSSTGKDNGSKTNTFGKNLYMAYKTMEDKPQSEPAIGDIEIGYRQCFFGPNGRGGIKTQQAGTDLGNQLKDKLTALANARSRFTQQCVVPDKRDAGHKAPIRKAKFAAKTCDPDYAQFLADEEKKKKEKDEAMRNIFDVGTNEFQDAAELGGNALDKMSETTKKKMPGVFDAEKGAIIIKRRYSNNNNSDILTLNDREKETRQQKDKKMWVTTVENKIDTMIHRVEGEDVGVRLRRLGDDAIPLLLSQAFDEPTEKLSAYKNLIDNPNLYHQWLEDGFISLMNKSARTRGESFNSICAIRTREKKLPAENVLQDMKENVLTSRSDVMPLPANYLTDTLASGGIEKKTIVLMLLDEWASNYKVNNSIFGFDIDTTHMKKFALHLVKFLKSNPLFLQLVIDRATGQDFMDSPLFNGEDFLTGVVYNMSGSESEQNMAILYVGEAASSSIGPLHAGSSGDSGETKGGGHRRYKTRRKQRKKKRRKTKKRRGKRRKTKRRKNTRRKTTRRKKKS